MNPSENPLVIHRLTKITEILGGMKGKLFKFENVKNEIIVVKFQNEDPTEPIRGTDVINRASGSAPKLRLAAEKDIDDLVTALRKIHRADQPDKQKFLDVSRSKKFKYQIIMEFAGGETIKSLRQGPLHGFLEVLKDPIFQFELGKIIAADAFASNPDRMYAKVATDKSNPTGWYHEQNLLIERRDKMPPKPVAIDNAFRPDNAASSTSGWGQYIGHIGVQWMSVASASPSMGRQEARALFRRFMSSALADHKDEKKTIDEFTLAHEESFTKFVSDGMAAAMELLLKRGQDWKTKLRLDSDDGLYKIFRIRKRALRVIRAQKDAPDAKAAFDLAEDDEKYRGWVLQHELQYSDEDAKGILKKGVESYKLAKLKGL